MVRVPNALFLVLFLATPWARADETVTLRGQRFDGILRKADFLVRDSGKSLPLQQLSFVKFPENAPPRPHCRNWHQVLLAGEQQLCGELVSVTSKEIRFRSAYGQFFSIPRQQLRGIVQTDGHLVQWREDFEGPTAVWTGKPTFSSEHAFAGKKSLTVQGGSKEVSLAIPPLQKPAASCRATIYFFEPEVKGETSAVFRLLFEAAGAQTPLALYLTTHGEYRGDAGYRLKASSGWHVIQVDWHDGTARVFIDDFLIASRSVPADARVASCQFSASGKGALWFDSLWLAKKALPARRSPGPPELDEVWLAGGEQVFGDVTDADEHGVTLDARFGKRAYPWSDVRGVFFRTQGQMVSIKGIEARFRSAAGVSNDCLRGEAVDLNEQLLVLRHAELGDLTIARKRLERIRFVGLAGK